MARPTKLSDKTQTQIVKILKTGVPISDACSFVGIAESTFYDWVKRGKDGDEKYTEFSEAVSRAKEAAKVTAIGTLRSAMTPYKQTTKTTETFTETRLKRDGTEYEYVRKVERESLTIFPGDWRAAVEYLKRRYRDEWSEKNVLEHEDWRSRAIADIRAGLIVFDALAEAFDDNLATELFRAAGVPIQSGQG